MQSRNERSLVEAQIFSINFESSRLSALFLQSYGGRNNKVVSSRDELAMHFSPSGETMLFAFEHPIPRVTSLLDAEYSSSSLKLSRSSSSSSKPDFPASLLVPSVWMHELPANTRLEGSPGETSISPRVLIALFFSRFLRALLAFTLSISERSKLSLEEKSFSSKSFSLYSLSKLASVENSAVLRVSNVNRALDARLDSMPAHSIRLLSKTRETDSNPAL
mmetsp:Transcript_17273/g.43052  ORF Transcript_17273/g.43052 Transcript_17273/m.43052 type:complete len:220 (+) Transcript_17273:553-1212(+)